MSEKYFIASNSSDGFCSYYGDTFDISKFSKIYAIKGGSGTGKAFFMKEIAKRAEERGLSVRYIYCSSDPSSLDAIIINETKIAVLDGTAPHIYEPHLVGAVDSIVDLGKFLNGDMLSRSRKQIESILNKKRQGFDSAYRYLKAYHLLSQNIEALIYTALKLEKIKKYANSLAKGIQEGNGELEHRITRAIGMRGLSSFDTYYENAKIYYEINDYFDSAHILLNEIFNAFRQKRADMYISNNPIIKDRLDALYTVKQGLCFEIGNQDRSDARRINMKRFVDVDAISKIRQEYRAIARLRDDSLNMALDEFEKIKKYHFILEKIYGSAMDFDAKEKFTIDFCNKIL